MRIRALIASAVIAAGFAGVAHAAIDKFTATSASDGVLGYFDMNATVFDGSSFQFVANTAVTLIDFVNPTDGYTITSIGPASQGTFIDSSVVPPTVVGGSGFTGGTDFGNGVWIYGSNGVILGDGGSGTNFSDVTWTTSAATPEPATWAMLILGMGAMGAVLRRRRDDGLVAA